METGTRDTIPLWLAGAITVCVALPFGIWLEQINPNLKSLPIWASFIVWAEYFALGARPSALRTIVPAFLLGVTAATIIMVGWALLMTAAGDRIWSPGDLTLFIACFVGFCIFVYAMRFFPVTQAGSLPFFNGISVMLGVYFTGAYPMHLLSTTSPIAPVGDWMGPLMAGAWALLAGLFGAFLGWFNVAIMFRRPVGIPASDPRPSDGHSAGA